MATAVDSTNGSPPDSIDIAQIDTEIENGQFRYVFYILFVFVDQ